jgi:hypothetical protein
VRHGERQPMCRRQEHVECGAAARLRVTSRLAAREAVIEVLERPSELVGELHDRRRREAALGQPIVEVDRQLARQCERRDRLARACERARHDVVDVERPQALGEPACLLTAGDGQPRPRLRARGFAVPHAQNTSHAATPSKPIRCPGAL